jgi:DNA-3-methyladenine glycosylase
MRQPPGPDAPRIADTPTRARARVAPVPPYSRSGVGNPDWLQHRFFQRRAEQVARDLLGKRLVRSIGDAVIGSTVVETEAYVGPHDLACHAARGRTARTEVMFGPPGTAYVYLIYGMHWMLNVVTGDEGYPAAVLIRGIDGVIGPGRLAAALGITGTLNGQSCSPATGLWFEKPATPAPAGRIMRTPRVGIDYAGPIWAAKKLRFVLEPTTRKRCRQH